MQGRQTNQSTNEQSITVQNADEAWIVVSAKTSFLAGEIYETEADRILNDALKSNLCETVSEAILSYQALFNRAGIRLPENEAVSHLTTDQRIERFQQQDDPSLAALYYNYGRYLLISSTRPGSLPPNLQGLWANEPGTPWNGDYHTNINVQMNHWPVEQANLSELYLPLVDLVKRLGSQWRRKCKSLLRSASKRLGTPHDDQCMELYRSRRTPVMGSNEYRRSMALRTLVGTLSFQWRPELSGRYLPDYERSFRVFLLYHGTRAQTRRLVTAPNFFTETSFLSYREKEPYAYQVYVSGRQWISNWYVNFTPT